MQLIPIENGSSNDRFSEEDEWFAPVDNKLTPYVGKLFNDVEEAITFYKVYALTCGFDVRRYTTKKWRDGSFKSKLIVCNREGFSRSKKVDQPKVSEVVGAGLESRRTKIRRIGCRARIRLFMRNGMLLIDIFHEGHNHELISGEDRQFQKLSRNLSNYHKDIIVNNSRLNIGATKTYRMCKEHVNGYENVGATLNDFKNFQRDVKCLIHGRDGQMFVDRFKNMVDARKVFYFDYDVNDDGSLRRVIWADASARRNYSVFGDVVSFDPTYSTNKYSMVFTPFTGVDNHKKSVTFCGALIAKEDYESFNWVFSRFLVAMGEFIKKLNEIIWDIDLEPSEFDSRWAQIMDEHGVGSNDWFTDTFDIRQQWVMAHCRDLKMGSVMRTTQRSESENSFFKKFEHKSGTLVEFWMCFESAMDQQRHSHKKLDNDSRHTSPKTISQLPIEIHGAKVYTHAVFDEFQEEVKYSMTTYSVSGFSFVNDEEVTTVNDALRDKKVDVHYNSVDDELIDLNAEPTEIGDGVDEKYIEMSNLWSEFHSTVGFLKGREKGDVEKLSTIIREFREKLAPSTEVVTSKHQDLEMILGCTTTEDISILPPKHSKNKGSGKRMVSSKTKAIEINKKPKRMCNNCKQFAHHDKRNCPYPFVLNPSPSGELSGDRYLEEEESE
ncbi:hypothetical protein RND81_12G057200 [Saponaria officinalis]|uniref:Protein FAR1-RELATED SEQUENCE n=1 Tax=Saponaria officinalis TaxID=3572 RepID=A0AAW1H5V2_SAPOF